MRHALRHPEPSQREVDLLKVLWKLGPSRVRQVHETLHSLGLSFNTVQTLLRIMEKKGLVEYRNEGRVFVYTARYTRESLVAGFLARVFDGKLIDLMESLLQQEDIDSQTQMKVRRIVAEALKKSQHHDP